MVDLFGHVGIGCRCGMRVSFLASGIAILSVPSRGASLGFRQGALHLLSLGSLRKAGGVDIEDAVLGVAWAVMGLDLYLSRSRRELLSRRAM